MLEVGFNSYITCSGTFKDRFCLLIVVVFVCLPLPQPEEKFKITCFPSRRHKSEFDLCSALQLF